MLYSDSASYMSRFQGDTMFVTVPSTNDSWNISNADTQTGIPSECPDGARCVQRLDDSQTAIRTNFRTSLRSSSMQEPRDPLLKVVSLLL